MLEPVITICNAWLTMELLDKEDVGIYISGHLFDDFKNELRFYTASSFLL